MNTTKISDLMRPDEIWRSEWDIDWKVVEVGERSAIVKRIGGRSFHTVTMRDVQDWERVERAA